MIAWAGSNENQGMLARVACLWHGIDSSREGFKTSRRPPRAQYHTKERTEQATGVALSPAAVALEYSKQASQADCQETISESAVDMAISLYRRALSLPAVMRVVRMSEEKYGSNTVFDSICKMQAMLQKASTPKFVEWVFCSVWDLFDNGELSGGVSVRILQGDRYTKSLPEVLIAKLGFNDWLLKKFLPHVEIPIEERSAIDDVSCKGHDHFRSKCGCSFGSGVTADTTWRAGWTKASDKIMELFEAPLRVLTLRVTWVSTQGAHAGFNGVEEESLCRVTPLGMPILE